ncbi:MAG TPA: ankyrin repeat domain-containing protein, partial [Gammaproteobacteria bacterium]|nr:ankyrin repeat domain-containing protein [Gammaproteobacteria bacterium]
MAKEELNQATQAIEAQFWQAMKAENVQEVAQLLKEHPVLVDSKNNTKLYPLHYAVSVGNIELTKAILSSVPEDKRLETLNQPEENDGYMPLHLAVINVINGLGDQQDMIKLLISQGAKNEPAGNMIFSPSELTERVAPTKNTKLLESTKSLIESEIVAHQEETVAELWQAIADNQISTAKQMLEKNPTLLNIDDNNGYKPIHVAVKNNQDKMVETFLEHNKEAVNQKTADGLTPLHVAVGSEKSSVEMVNLLLTNGADFNAAADSRGTPANFAIQNRRSKEGAVYAALVQKEKAIQEYRLQHLTQDNVQHQEAEAMAKQQASIKAAAMSAETSKAVQENPITTSADHASIPSEKTAAPQSPDASHSRSRLESQYQAIEIRQLAEQRQHDSQQKQQVEDTRREDVRQELAEAIRVGDTAKFNALFNDTKNGNISNERLSFGNQTISPAHLAAVYGRVEMLEAIGGRLKADQPGANIHNLVEVVNNQAMTPLQFALLHHGEKEPFIKNDETIKYLCKASSTDLINRKDVYGMTPLMQVIANGSPSMAVIKHLIGQDARVNIKNLKGETAIDLLKEFADSVEKNEIAKLLFAGQKQTMAYHCTGQEWETAIDLDMKNFKQQYNQARAKNRETAKNPTELTEKNQQAWEKFKDRTESIDMECFVKKNIRDGRYDTAKQAEAAYKALYGVNSPNGFYMVNVDEKFQAISREIHHLPSYGPNEKTVKTPDPHHLSSTTDVISIMEKSAYHAVIEKPAYGANSVNQENRSTESQILLEFLKQLENKIYDKKLNALGVGKYFGKDDGIVAIREQLEGLHPCAKDKEILEVFQKVKNILNKKDEENAKIGFRSDERKTFYHDQNGEAIRVNLQTKQSLPIHEFLLDLKDGKIKEIPIEKSADEVKEIREILQEVDEKSDMTKVNEAYQKINIIVDSSQQEDGFIAHVRDQRKEMLEANVSSAV